MIAIAGSLGTDATNTVLDLLLIVEGSEVSFIGVLREPIDLGDLIHHFAPGVSVGGLTQPGGTIMITEAVAVFNRGEVVLMVNLTFFDVTCEGQLIISKNEGADNGELGDSQGADKGTLVQLYILVEGGMESNAFPFGAMKKLLGDSADWQFTFALATKKVSTSQSVENPAGSTHGILQRFASKFGTDEDGADNEGVLAVVNRAKVVTGRFASRNPLPSLDPGAVRGNSFGPGVLIAIEMDAESHVGQVKNATAPQNTSRKNAFHDSLDSMNQGQILFVLKFEWENEMNVEFLTVIAPSTDVTTGHSSLVLKDFALILKVEGLHVSAGIAVDLEYTTCKTTVPETDNPCVEQKFIFSGEGFLTSDLELTLELQVDSDRPWHPFGLGDNLAIQFPVALKVGFSPKSPIGLSELAFTGGIEVLGVTASFGVELSIGSDSEAMCMSVDNFNLATLVESVACEKWNQHCLSPTDAFLTDVSLESGLISINTGPLVTIAEPSTIGQNRCAQIPEGVRINIFQMVLLGLTIDRLCMIYTPPASFSALVEIEPITLGALKIEGSDDHRCLPRDTAEGTCASSHSTHAGTIVSPSSGPSLKFAFDLDTSKPGSASFFFSGQLDVAVVGSIDACVIVDSKGIYAHLNTSMEGTDIAMDGLVAASYGKASDLSFEVSFEISAEGGIIQNLVQKMTQVFDEFQAKLEAGAAAAKAALQSGFDDVETAKHKVEAARQAINSGFGALEDDVSYAQNKLESLQRDCDEHDHCGW